ncbi:hypothetical protein [Streptomyces huiliensis]|uniref:hypothetical protein n=1 Tax=Streptomyces huiliensis TaxID=2876027 RepID=UPI001CBE8CB9|nr:hypothetical protein [Streptomyces huiliensis]MBZ4323711.1 hypothetical protein [Streptomyces huiliensis]
MTMVRHFGIPGNAARVALAACAALALSGVVPTEAAAAVGKFEYAAADGVNSVFVNPPTGPCIGLTKEAVSAGNYTDTDANLYEGLACSGHAEPLPKGTGKSWGTFRPNSVRFG